MSNVGKTTIQIQSDSSQARRDYESFFRFVENGLKRLENVARSTDPLQTLANKTSQHTANIIEQLNRVGATAESVFRRIDAAGRGSGAGNSLNRQLQQTQQALTATDQRARQSGSAFNELDGKIRVLTAQLQSASTGMGGFSNSTEQLRGRMEIMRNLTDQYRIKLEQLREKHRAAASAEGENAQSTQRYAEQIHRTTTEINRLDQSMTNAQTQLNQQTSMIGRFTNGMENMGQRMQNFGMTMTTTFGTATYGLGRFLKSAVEESMNFEQQMANIKAVSGATADTMDELSKLAVKYGEDTKYSSVEAGKGIEELIKAGVSLTDIINGGLEGALNLATAGELDLGDAAQIASTALNAFKADNLSVTDAANLLAGAANASATNVKEMQYGLSMVSAVAAGVGLSFKDTSTALALFAQNGLRGSDAGTSLKTMMANLIPKSKEAYELFSELGLISFDTGKAMQYLSEKGVKPASNSYKDIMVSLEEYAAKQAKVKVGSSKAEEAFKKLTFSTGIMHNAFFDANGNLKGMADIAEVVQMAMQGLTAEQRQSYLYTLFGSDAIRAANILYKEGADGVKNMYSEMSKVTALDVATTKMETTKGQIEELSGAYDTLKKTIGDALLPTVRMIVSAFQGLVDWFNNLDKSTQETIAGTGLLVVALMGVAGAVGILSLALGALLANPVALAITGAVLGIGLLGAAVLQFSNDSKQATSDYEKFGGTVSEGTRKAAGAYIDLKDKAINSMIDLQLKTGEEANKAADETIKAFQRMTNEVVKELEGKKSQFNKMFSQLMGTVPEGAKESLEQVKNNIIESINKEIEVATEAEKILEEGIKKYHGDTMKMPKDFAQKFDQALQVADKNVQQFYSKAKEITSISKEIESGGMLSVDAGRKRFESIIKVYDDGVKSLEKQTKGWRENVEKAFKLGEIKPEERKATLDAIALYEAKHVEDLRTIRGDAFKVLEGHLKAEDAALVFANANKLEAEKKGWQEKTKAYLFGHETYEEVSQRFYKEQEKAEKDHKDKLLAFELQYGKSKIESIGMYVGELQKGTESSRLLAESMAREIDGKMKIDLGPAGQYTIDTFLEKIKKGELDSTAVATANANKLKDVYKVDLSQSGIESMQKWIEGIKTKDTGEVREFLSRNMQSDTVIDLGIYGKMSMDSWITGLQNGTLSFDTVFQFFQQTVKNGMNVDATQEGQNNIQTLINGMQIGALTLPQVAQTMGLDIKSNVQVDLGESGKFNVQTLVQGMQDGSINAELAAKAIAALVKNGAKVDLTQQGTDGVSSYGDAIQQGEGKVRGSAHTLSNATEEELNKTDGKKPGEKVGDDFSAAIVSKEGPTKRAAGLLSGTTKEELNKTDGKNPGEKVGDDFSAAIVSKEGPTKRAAGLLLGKAEEELNKRDLKLPDIKLGVLPRIPQLKILGGFSLSPLSVPNIEWHKHGGFFDSARIIGIGEAGPEAAVPLVGRRMDPFADAVFNRFANRFRSAFGTNSPNSDKQFDLTIYLSGFIQPIIEALLDTTNKIEKHFETLGSKIIGVTDNLKDVLSQQIDSNINLEAASDAVKNTLQNAQRNLSEQFMYNMDSKIPTLSASRIPNLNNVMTAVQPAASDNREINLTVNLNALMDGKSVAEITAPYTTEIQEREKQQRSRFKG